MIKVERLSREFSKLNDNDRWKFIQKLSPDDYIVVLDKDSTFVLFIDHETMSDIAVDFDEKIGTHFGITLLLDTLGINYEVN